MNKRDALRLKRGDVVRYGNSMWTRHIEKASEARVLFVTQNGGVRAFDNNTHTMVWIPYHFIIRKIGNSPIRQRPGE